MEVIELKIGNAVILGDEVVFRILDVRCNTVQLGFDAPREVQIVRSELILSPEARLAQRHKRYRRAK